MDWNSLIDVYFSGANKNPTLDAINFSLSSIEPEQGIMKNGMTRYRPPNGLNWGYFSDPEVDRLGEESLAQFGVAKRNALIGKMHEKLVPDAYEIFIVHDLNPRALSPKLTGFVQAQSWFRIGPRSSCIPREHDRAEWDPRSGNTALHDLHELRVVALCAVLSGRPSVGNPDCFGERLSARRRSALHGTRRDP
jgi:hypothetical protein